LSNVEQPDKEVHINFVGNVEEKWRQDSGKASEITQRADIPDSSNFVLQALNHKAADLWLISPADPVNLNRRDRKFSGLHQGWVEAAHERLGIKSAAALQGGLHCFVSRMIRSIRLTMAT
jgi:hypothetical protein